MTRTKSRGAAWALAVVLAACTACAQRGDTPESGASDTSDASLAAGASGASGAPAASPRAAASTPGVVALCEHRVPAELCTRCVPDLVPVFKSQGDWCDAHGVPESQCLLCNPGLDFAARAAPADWCREHAVPESQCTKCKPRLVAQFIEAGDYCREHGYPESVCPICHPDLVSAAGATPPVFPTPGTLVRLASPETAAQAGIETEPVERRPFSRTLEVVGQLAFNENRRAKLSARGDALILEVNVDVGDKVAKGQGLVVLSSSAVGADQAQLSASAARLQTARAALDRQARLAERGVIPRKDVEDAERELAAAQAEHDAARSALHSAGASSDGSGGRYVLAAPFAGTVVARDAVVGRTATSEQVIVEVADLSVMWALLEIPEAEAIWVRAGQRARITLDSAAGVSIDGVVARVGAIVDPGSRTVTARVELPNADARLKAGAFLRARIEIESERDALVVPKEAIQIAENHALVFVKREDAVYEPVAVQLGQDDEHAVEIVAGLSHGMEVVTTGAFLLKTEILKESIGAGCCEVDAPGAK